MLLIVKDTPDSCLLFNELTFAKITIKNKIWGHSQRSLELRVRLKNKALNAEIQENLSTGYGTRVMVKACRPLFLKYNLNLSLYKEFFCRCNLTVKNNIGLFKNIYYFNVKNLILWISNRTV